jgi:hypothetical protein
MSNITDSSAKRKKRVKLKTLTPVGRAPSTKNEKKVRRAKVAAYEASVTLDVVREDVTKTRAALEKLYPGTFQAWKNMLYDRTKTEGAIVAPEWKDFRRFLGDMGPRRHGDFQLDRINTHDKRYGPGLCRWADSVQQSNNRRTTIVLTHPETSPVPLTEVAKHLGMKTDTLRKQVREGRPLPEAKSLRTWFRSTRTPESGGLGL